MSGRRVRSGGREHADRGVRSPHTGPEARMVCSRVYLAPFSQVDVHPSLVESARGGRIDRPSLGGECALNQTPSPDPRPTSGREELVRL